MRGCVVLLALSMLCCSHVKTASPVGKIKPRMIPGICEDPPTDLPDGVIWLRPPCTLLAERSR